MNLKMHSSRVGNSHANVYGLESRQHRSSWGVCIGLVLFSKRWKWINVFKKADGGILKPRLQKGLSGSKFVISPVIGSWWTLAWLLPISRLYITWKNCDLLFKVTVKTNLFVGSEGPGKQGHKTTGEIRNIRGGFGGQRSKLWAKFQMVLFSEFYMLTFLAFCREDNGGVQKQTRRIWCNRWASHEACS